jgi:hypothetical protein
MMNTSTSILSNPSSATVHEKETPEPHHFARKSSEPFDALMNRAIAHPAQNQSVNHSSRKIPGALGSLSPGRVRQAPKMEFKKPVSLPREQSHAVALPLSPTNLDVSVRELKSEKPAEGSSHDGEAGAANAKPSDPATALSADSEATSGLALTAQTQASPQGTVVAGSTFTNGNVSGSVALAEASLGSANPSHPQLETGSSKLETLSAPAKESLNSVSAFSAEISALEMEPAKISAPLEGKVPVSAELDDGQTEGEFVPIAGNSAGNKESSDAPDPRGTSGAQQAATMKNAAQASENAGSPEQEHPAVTVVSAAQSAAAVKPVGKGASRSDSVDSTSAASSAAMDRTPTLSDFSPSSLISDSSQTELRVRALDRTHDIVALHGMRLKESGIDSLHVIIKPGSGIQISLQLKQNGDVIEAQAILNRGDFQQLNQHWSELQQRLEERGIRLAPLGNESSTASNDSHFQQSKHQPADSESLSAGAFAEFALAGAVAGSSTPAAAHESGQRGWESWA